MIHAYDESLISRSADSLGRMLDFSVYSLHYSAAEMMDLFIASGVASDIGRGSIRLICGMSGVELAYEVLWRAGLSYDRATPRYTKSLSNEYWCGYAIAFLQWQTCLPFHQITQSFSVQNFISEFTESKTAFLDGLPFYLDANERSEKIKVFGREYAVKHAADAALLLSSAMISDSNGNISLNISGDTPLKAMRIKNGLSQSGLAKASGVPLRTIQQYEQRQKDIRKARSEYLIALSRALNCDPSCLLGY